MRTANCKAHYKSDRTPNIATPTRYQDWRLGDKIASQQQQQQPQHCMSTASDTAATATTS
eukprot:4427-Heterococcus_DN1.PRE.2